MHTCTNHSFTFIQLSITSKPKCQLNVRLGGGNIQHNYYNNLTSSRVTFTVQVLPLETLQILAIILLPVYLQIAKFRKKIHQERAYEFCESQMQNKDKQKTFLRVAHRYKQ